MLAPHSAHQSGSLTMRVDRRTRQSVDDLAKRLGISMQDVLAQAVESYRRSLIVSEANDAYARLRADPVASREYDREHALFEQALGDGIGDDPYPI